MPTASQELIAGLLRRRLIGRHDAPFALSTIGGVEQADEGPVSVYRVFLQPLESHPYITTAQQRKASIQGGVKTWGAAGFCPLVRMHDGTTYLAALYRDAGAPSYPDHYTTPSGLSHLVGGRAEPVELTGQREAKEELLFLDGRSPGGVIYDQDRKMYVAKLQELAVPQRVIKDGRTRVEVYRGGSLIDTAYPFSIGWGEARDTVTTLVDLSVFFPDDTVPVKHLQAINGEIVERRLLSREVALLRLEPLLDGSAVPIIRYATDPERDMVFRTELELPAGEIKMTHPLQGAVEKIRSAAPASREEWFA
ncbi:MAG: hypothetical protein HY520_01350 [Candidatus Aenigmarchaeota archaeon]|nr:hypothetical protein [Candidatus Aenigmarchaeota archaeon]